MIPRMDIKTTLVILLLVLAHAPGCAGDKHSIPEIPFEGPETIDAYLDTFLEAPGGPPSISIAVAVGGKIVLAEAAGWADIKSQVAATPETTYRTYSISKGLTALAVVQLIEREKLSRPVGRLG